MPGSQETRREAAELVQAIGRCAADELVKTAIARAAVLLGWTVNRTEDIWRGEARRIDAYEMDQLRKFAISKTNRENGG